MSIDSVREELGGDTRQRIIDVARALFSERSYLGVSMSDIAKRLSMTKAALYYHFTGKTELYLDVLRDVFAELRRRLEVAQTEDDDTRQLLRMVTVYLEFGAQENNLLNALFARLTFAEKELREFVTACQDEVICLFAPVIARILESNQSDSRKGGETVAVMLTAMMNGLALSHTLLRADLDQERMAAQVVDALVLGRGDNRASHEVGVDPRALELGSVDG
jgi:AcrR family transcriptional regulator